MGCGCSHSAIHPAADNIGPANRTNSIVTTRAFLVAKASLILMAARAAGRGSRTDSDSVFEAGVGSLNVAPESEAVAVEAGSADAAL